MLQSVSGEFTSRFACAMPTEFVRVQTSPGGNGPQQRVTERPTARAALDYDHVGTQPQLPDNLRLIQFVIDPVSLAPTGLGGPAWGLLGDRMVLGNWTAGSSGNQFGLMVARKTATAWEWYLFPNGTPTSWGLPGDFPVSINVDLDRKNDIAVYRPSDQKLYVIRSSDGQQVILGPFGSVDSIPLGYLQGTTAPLEF